MLFTMPGTGESLVGEPAPSDENAVTFLFDNRLSSLDVRTSQRRVRLPAPGPSAGTPILYQHDGNRWRRVAAQNYHEGRIDARLPIFGFYQLFTPIKNLPFDFGEVYVYPNPSREGDVPTLHIEIGQAESLSTRIYDVSGDLVYESSINDAPIVVEGRPAYEHPLDADRFRPGVYIGVVTAEKSGRETVRKKFRFTVVK